MVTEYGGGGQGPVMPRKWNVVTGRIAAGPAMMTSGPDFENTYVVEQTGRGGGPWQACAEGIDTTASNEAAAAQAIERRAHLHARVVG
jgi:hypothetical protein